MSHAWRFVILVLALETLGLGCAESTRAPAGHVEQRVQGDQTTSTNKAASSPETLGEFVSFPAAGVKIRQPAQLEKADTFDGFGHEGSQSSIVVMSIPGPFTEISKGFSKEQMASRAMRLLDKTETTVGECQGVLVHFEQSAMGTTYEKWSLVFGDDNKTVLVTSNVPKEVAKEFSPRLKEAVLSTQPDTTTAVDPTASVPFTITPAGGLKLSKGQISRSLAYTLGGALPTKSPTDPIFIAAPSIGSVSTANSQATAENRLRALAQVQNVAIWRTKPIAIDGLEGFETIADAEDKSSGTPIVVYQVMLFGDNSYIVMAGIVGKARADEFMEAFKEMSLSLKRKEN